MPARSTSKSINDKEEYDDVLDDGPILPKNLPCLEISTNLYEDKNDELADNTLTNESPTLFLSYPNYTIEEKLAYVENYLYGLQLSLVPNLSCNHDIELNNDHSNYFKEESMLMNSIKKSMTLFMCLKYLSCMIHIVILMNLLLVIPITMKEEVISSLLILVIIICIHLLIIIMGILSSFATQSSIKCPCIGRK